MKSKAKLSCVVNGERVSGEWSSSATLLDVLRQKLALRSVKVGCERGECGSCTVLVNDKPALACQVKASDAAEKSVTTWEGVGVAQRNEYANALANSGLACGFCIPGILMRWLAETASGLRPSREQILSLLAQHYCRCTGYASWIQAFQQMSLPRKIQQKPTVSVSSGSEVRRVPRLDESEGARHLLSRLLAGEPYFVDDLEVAEMLEASLAFVPQAFGQVQAIDVQGALAQSGVVAVLSSQGLLYGSDFLRPYSLYEDADLDTEVSGELGDFDTIVSSPRDASELLLDEQSFSHSLLLSSNQSLLQMQGGASPTLESFVGLVSFQDWSDLERDELDSEEWVEPMDGGVDEKTKVDHQRGFSGHDGHSLLVELDHHIRSCGDVVALVLAEERQQARDAAASISVEVEEVEEPTLETEYASQRGWEDEALSLRWDSGDIATVFREAHAVVSGTWTTSAAEAGCLEPPSCLVVPLVNGQVKVFSAGHSATTIQSVVARAVNLEPQQVDVSLLPAGGSFGTRATPFLEAYAAKAAVATERPVKLTLSRNDMARLMPKRHATRIHMSMACDEQGRILGLSADFLGDTGGLAEEAETVLRCAMAHIFGPYRVPVFSIRGKMLCSNMPHAGAVTGEGMAQACFALESLMDMMSQRLGIDPWVLRYSNVLEPGDALPNGQLVGPDCRAKQTLEAVRDTFYKLEGAAGIACSWMGYDEFFHSTSEVRVSLCLDGEQRCHVMLPQADCGRNLYVRVLQLLADECELGPEQIVLNVGASPLYELPAAHRAEGCNSSWGILEAVRHAARKLRRARRTSQSLVNHEFVGVWKREERGSRPVSLKEKRRSSSASMPSLGVASYEMPIYRGHSFATQVVALHPEHGRLRRVVIACDLGEPHKPERYVQQVEGSVQAGLKYALREKLLTEEGIPKVSSLCHSEGMAPNSLPHIQTILVAASNSEQDASMLEKGEGDVAMFGVAPALASAIEQLHGQRYFELPMEKANLAQPLRDKAIIKSS